MFVKNLSEINNPMIVDFLEGFIFFFFFWSLFIYCCILIGCLSCNFFYWRNSSQPPNYIFHTFFFWLALLLFFLVCPSTKIHCALDPKARFLKKKKRKKAENLKVPYINNSSTDSSLDLFLRTLSTSLPLLTLRIALLGHADHTFANDSNADSNGKRNLFIILERARAL
jgi:hypothetical protein